MGEGLQMGAQSFMTHKIEADQILDNDGNVSAKKLFIWENIFCDAARDKFSNMDIIHYDVYIYTDFGKKKVSSMKIIF